MNINELTNYLPHRYPFLLVDRVVEMEPDSSIVGLKNVTVNEEFFLGHFPGNPIMPGVLIVEAMAQTAAILAIKSGDMDIPNIYFMSIEKAKFRRPVIPGDQLRFEVQVLKKRGNVYKFTGRALVGDAVAAEAEFSAMMAAKE